MSKLERIKTNVLISELGKEHRKSGKEQQNKPKASWSKELIKQKLLVRK